MIWGGLGSSGASRGMRWAIAALAVLAFAAGTSEAFAYRAVVRGLTTISGLTPFADGCGVRGEPTLHSEAEPYVAVNPRNPRNIVATFQQDRFAVNGGALSNLVATSMDGGRTWSRVRPRRLSACTGGEDERTSDPWVSIAPDGTVYLASLTFDDIPGLSEAGLAAPTQQLASVSRNGGRSFSAPVTVAADGTYNDREAVTADPTRPGHAYLAWVKRYGAFGESGLSMLSRTTDGGRSWSQQQLVHATPPGTLPDPILIEVLPDGTLLNLFLQANLTPFLPEGAPIVPWEVMALRSSDQGETWSSPVRIGSIGQPFPPHDPDTGAEVRAFPVIDSAVAPNGRAYVVWNEILSERRSKIFISRSRDGGRSWSEPRTVAGVRSQAFIPNVEVDGRGTLGVTWDDFGGDRSGDGELSTNVRFAHSHDGGRSWRRIRVAGPFDMLTASKTSSTQIAGRFVGDYQGLAGRPSGFVAAFAHAKPMRPRDSGAPRIRGPSDIIFARLRVGSR